MEKVPFIYRKLLFGTGAIKAQQCYLSLQKGFVRHRAEGEKGKEKAKEGGDHWKLAETEGRTVYLFIPMSLPLLHSSPTVLSRFTCCGKIHSCNKKTLLVAVTVWKADRFTATEIQSEIKPAGLFQYITAKVSK